MVFDTSIDGHHLEYIHHIHEAACEKFHNLQFFFAVPKEFKQQSNKFSWESCNWVKIVYIDSNDIQKCDKGNYFTKAWNYSKILKKYTQLYNIDELFLITLIYPYPFLPLFLNSKTKVSGIIYRIYLYEWKLSSFIKKCKDAFEMWIMTKSKTTKSIFVLNDHSATCYFNKLFNVNKFKFIIDPILPLSYTSQNIRNQLGIDESERVYLHFGAMTKRKGTLDILDAIEMLSEKELNGKVFVFAGKIKNTIKNAFYERKQRLEKKAKIIVYDQFCSYEFLSDLCNSCDVVLVPYKNTSYSSGVLGYVALFNKMVIGPKEGLLGKLIRRNNLGYAKTSMDAKNLARVIAAEQEATFSGKNYVSKNDVKTFTNIIFEALVD